MDHPILKKAKLEFPIGSQAQHNLRQGRVIGLRIDLSANSFDVLVQFSKSEEIWITKTELTPIPKESE